MKRYLFSLISICTMALALAAIASAQVRPPTPRGSQKATVSQTLGTTEVSVTYSRPAIFGRKVFGDWPKPTTGEATLDNGNERPKDAPLVPWGHVWRTGANEATGGGYARLQTTWTAGSTGTNSGSVVNISCAAGTYVQGGIWSASSSGTFVGSAAFGGGNVVVSGTGASISVTPSITV